MFQRAALPIASTATGSAHTESFRSFPLRRSALVGLAGCAILVLCATAQAQVVRFVSSGGNDANNCMRATPCLTLQRGIDRTPPNGELQILDSGNYADTPATISRSIAISADGVTANVGGIIVNGVGIVVALRGLHLAGRGLADTSGVAIGNAAATVSIERCTIEQFRAHGVQDPRGHAKHQRRRHRQYHTRQCPGRSHNIGPNPTYRCNHQSGRHRLPLRKQWTKRPFDLRHQRVDH